MMQFNSNKNPSVDKRYQIAKIDRIKLDLGTEYICSKDNEHLSTNMVYFLVEGFEYDRLHISFNYDKGTDFIHVTINNQRGSDLTRYWYIWDTGEVKSSSGKLNNLIAKEICKAMGDWAKAKLEQA